MKKRSSKHNKCRNAGTTLVEIIVTFALLGIFLAAAAAIIGMITNQYYNVKGETYSKQVTDIIMEKVASEIEGAKYYEQTVTGTDGNEEEHPENPDYASDFTSLTLNDRTDTRLKIHAVNGELLLDYFTFQDVLHPDKSREATTWKFDRGVYNGYSLEELYFVRGDQLGGANASTLASRFGFSSSRVSYGKGVTVVFIHVKSPKYGDYYSYRVVRMYNVE